MKKILLILLVILGLQVKAQINICDSIEYSIQSAQSGQSSTTLTLSGTANIPNGVVTSWNWAACHSTLCFAASGQVAMFNQFITTDTIKLCLTTVLDINGMMWTCNQCDSLVWNGLGWMLLHGGNPVSVIDIKNIEYDNKIYDILGREFYDYNSIPKGTLYIKNRNKYIR